MPRGKPIQNGAYNDYRIDLQNSIVYMKLTQGQETIFDLEDLEKVKGYRWYAQWNSYTKSYYVQTHLPKEGGKRKILSLHRLLADAGRGLHVDHVNHNTLDNRKENLRVCTCQENSRNSHKQSNNTSGYIGVNFNKGKGKWCAYYSLNGKLTHIGSFSSALEAAQARDAVVREHYGAFAQLNFP